MNTQDIVKQAALRLYHKRLLWIGAGVLVALLFILYAAKKPTIYTSRSSVFPLTAGNDNMLAKSTLSSILGINDAPQSFSQEASINIVELALSRNTREAVALTSLPEFNNELIASLIIKEYNKHLFFWEKKMEITSDTPLLAARAAELLKYAIEAKINKNGILEIAYKSSNKELVRPISYTIIDKISGFYIDLKIKKAKADYDFTVKKIDSLENVLSDYDKRAIRLSNTTMFVPGSRIEYQIPKENLVAEKDRVVRQRDASANNREEALWRLQKATPIIATLDRPDPPYEFKKTSKILFGVLGFAFGAFLCALAMSAGFIWKYIKLEVKSAIFNPPQS